MHRPTSCLRGRSERGLPAPAISPAHARVQGARRLDDRATGTFYGGGAIRRLVRLYHESPRIDFETELNDIPNYTVVVAEFPLAMDICRCGAAFRSVSRTAPGRRPMPNCMGGPRRIVPAVRWVDYAFSGGGFAILRSRPERP